MNLGRFRRVASSAGIISLFLLRSVDAHEFDAATTHEMFSIESVALFPFSLSVPALLRPAEPFGLPTAPPLTRELKSKWLSVEEKLPSEHGVLARCRNDASECTPAAARFLHVINEASGRDGWVRIAAVNRAINLDLKPVTDMAQYGVVDLWATPLMAFASNAGDCEDYAIAKYVALRETGTPAEDLRLVIVYDRSTHEDHAVAAVRYDNRWLVLDNRTLELRSDADIPNYDPLFVIGGEGLNPLAANTQQSAERSSEPDMKEFSTHLALRWLTAQLPL